MEILIEYIEMFNEPYLIFIFIFTGLFVFIFDTEENYLYGNNKDYIISFFSGLINIFAGIILLLIRLFI